MFNYLPTALGHRVRLAGISQKAARGLHRLSLENIRLDNNPWIEPPQGAVDKGLGRIVSFWEAMSLSGTVVSWKLKVVLVGAVKAGKTSLASGMIHGEPRLCPEEERTKGVDVHVCEPCRPNAERNLELIFWDFAGHEEYFSTHQIFLSQGALHLLVVDLLRYSNKPSKRDEMVNVWLDTLQRHVPGSNVLVVATKTDRLTGGFEAKLRDLQRRVESHISMQRDEIDRTRGNTSTYSDLQQGLIFHGVEAVSSTCPESLSTLRLRLATLVYSERDKFPSVGQRYPKPWIRVSKMFAARRSGQDPIKQASLRPLARHDEERLEGTTTGVKFLHRTDALEEWSRVVQTLRLENEVRSNERDSEGIVFEDAVGQLVREGTVLESGNVLFLEPTWINELLKAIFDHEAAHDTAGNRCDNELMRFSNGDQEVYWNLKSIHNNFATTGVLTVRYLRFLWRDVADMSDNTLFQALLGIMSRHGVIINVNPSGASRENAGNDRDDRPELFVPLHLPSTIPVSHLEELQTMFRSESQEEMVYEISQPYIPPGILGLLMAKFLLCDGLRFRKCWGHGVAFKWGQVFALLQLDAASGNNKAQITVNLFGNISEISVALARVECEIKSVVFGSFRGLFLSPKHGYPRRVSGIRGGDDMTGMDVVNAVVARVDKFESHFDREQSRVHGGLQELQNNLQEVVINCRSTVARLNRFQSEEVPCPNLVVIRPAAAVVPGEQNRSLWAMIDSWWHRARNGFSRDMRLCFLCPHDFSEVPCGVDGNGYPIATTTYDESTKRILYPVLKATAVVVKTAVNTAGGVHLPVPEFLEGALSSLEESMDDQMIGAIVKTFAENVAPEGGEGVALSGRGVEEHEVRTLVGSAYGELREMVKRCESRRMGGVIHFNDVMQLEDDGEGGKIWVSKKNVAEWRQKNRSQAY